MAKQKNNSSQCPVYVVAGKDTALVNKNCRELLDELLKGEDRTTALLKGDSSDISGADVLDELRTLPFLAKKRVVYIQNAEDFVSENRELLEKYFQRPSSTGVLVLAVKSWRSNTRLAKIVDKVGQTVRVAEPKPWEIPDMLVAEAKKRYGKKLDKQAAELLVEMAGDNLAVIYSELEKMVLYVGDETMISADKVGQLVGNNRFFNVFAVIDSATRRQPAKAVERLRIMFEEDKSTEYTSVGAFAYHFRKMFQAKAMLDKGVAEFEAAKRAKVFGNRKQFFNQLRRMSLKQTGDFISKLAEIDYQIKTGQANARVAIEQLVLQLSMI